MRPRLVLAAIAALGIAAPALAVGLGPLAKSGITDGPAKAFWLTVSNPYDEPREFRAYAITPDGEDVVGEVVIRPALIRLGPGRQRRFLVEIDNIAPGATRIVRVCAELAHQEGTIHARVCSKLSARRVAAGA